MKIPAYGIVPTTLLSLLVLCPPETFGQAGEHLPAWTQSASTCAIDEAEASQTRYSFNNADLTFRAGQISMWSGGPLGTVLLPIVARCNVENPLDTGNPAWNRLVVGYIDPNGAGSVNVKLKRISRPAGTVTTVATFTAPSTDLFTRTEKSVAFVHAFDFLKNQYLIEIQIVRHDTDGNPGVYMLRLTQADGR